MKPAITETGSLRYRLILQLLIIAALLSVGLYFAVRSLAQQAASETQDNILLASATAMAETVRFQQGEILLDIPYSALSMLGSISEERVFYRVIADEVTVTGYHDLPVPQTAPRLGDPAYMTTKFRNDEIRIAAVSRRLTAGNTTVPVVVLVAQTRAGLAAITARISIAAAAVGIGFFVISGLLSWVAAQSALRPLQRLAEAVGRRGAHDLRPVRTEAPSELVPLLVSLNSFMDRLRASLIRTEEFIAEAAHHVRTPLATVRTQAEIALRSVNKPSNKKTLREVIRAVDESSRSAGQLLDHAMVTFRSDNLSRKKFDLETLALDVIRSISPTAELKDIEIEFIPQKVDGQVEGDAILLQSALRNLLDNAVKYSPADTTISVSLDPLGDFARVQVRDQGRGIDGADTETIMRRFERGSNVGDVVGSGLGLTIVDEVARAHGGYLEINQNSGVPGTCASLTLPLV